MAIVEAPWRDGQPVSVGVVRDLFEDAQAGGHPVSDLAFRNLADSYWIGEGIPGFTAIETWATSAIERYAADGELSAYGPALRWQPTDNQPILAWHDMSAVVIPIRGDDRELLIDYEPDDADRERESSLLGGLPAPECVLDWRLYVGRNSAIVDGAAKLKALGGKLRATIRLGERIGNAEGVLVGKVHNSLGTLDGLLTNDPSWESRLDDLEMRFPALAERYPRLGPSQPLNDRSAAIIVHGTRSCALPALNTLSNYLRLPARRYEHDTFVPLIDNAEELATLIEQSVSCARLVLIAHSRGGLIARLAASLLRQQAWTGTAEVWTFGTPHEGTPLVGRSLEVVAKLVGASTKVGTLLKLDTPTDEFGVPIEDPVTAAFSLLLSSSRIPPGIEAMREGSEILRMIPAGTTDVAYGAICDLATAQAGFTVDRKTARASGFAREVFRGEPNDLVVGISSSTAPPGGRRVPAPCAHSEYFRDPTVTADLAAL